jgi:hypothetical protein
LRLGSSAHCRLVEYIRYTTEHNAHE